MSNFINTIDQLGDDVVLKSLIDRSITEFKDNVLTTNLKSYAFGYCTNLKEVRLPKVTGNVDGYAFSYCTNLETVEFCENVTFTYGVFTGANNMKALILRSNQICKDISGSKLTGTCYIYVPSSLVESYKTASYWKSHASYIRALEDYTVDGTTTGELDPTKI